MWRQSAVLVALLLALAGWQWLQFRDLGSTIQTSISRLRVFQKKEPLEIRVMGDSFRLGNTWTTTMTINGESKDVGVELILVQEDAEEDDVFATRYKTKLESKLEAFPAKSGTLKSIVFQTLPH